MFPVLASVSQSAQALLDHYSWVSNSFVVSIIVMAILFFFSLAATKKLAYIPAKAQNFFEVLVDGIYSSVESMLGKKLTKQAFPLLATTFLFLLISNWLGLVPGVGTLGFGTPVENGAFLSVQKVTRPFLRPPGADLNNNLAIAFLFMFAWLIISVRSVGIKDFLAHLFAPKGDFKGLMKLLMILVFLFVGFLEIISISVRPFSLSLRLYGNIFAGENLLHEMSALGQAFGLTGIWEMIMRVFVPIPFYFLEILVGFLQAVVFTLLCTVYIQLSATHDEEHAH